MADNSTGVVFPWEQAAIRGDEMPDGLSYPDQILFLGLRMLYAQKRAGIINRDTAVVEKKKLLDEYRVYTFREKMGDEWVEQIRLTEIARAEYRKNRTLENADKLVLLIEGRNFRETDTAR